MKYCLLILIIASACNDKPKPKPLSAYDKYNGSFYAMRDSARHYEALANYFKDFGEDSCANCMAKKSRAYIDSMGYYAHLINPSGRTYLSDRPTCDCK